MGALTNFDFVCERVSLPACIAMNASDAICYSRNIPLGSLLLFAPAVLIIDIFAIIMTVIMIAQIKSKYTSVGRKEMVQFFYSYLFCILLDFLLVSNIIPFHSSVYKYFAAIHFGAIQSTFGLLLLNSFVGFQWIEDGTSTSLWGFRIFGIFFFLVGFILSLLTFLRVLGSAGGIIMYVLYFGVPAACVLIYAVSQIILALHSVGDMWPIGDILLGLIFLSGSIVATFVFSNEICNFALHYVDGMFLGSSLLVLSVMMVYKYWDSITKDDLEFAIGGAPQIWHLKSDKENKLY